MSADLPDDASEVWARDLMQRAADTIDVTPSGPFVVTAQPRSWRPAFAAAGVTLIVGLVAVSAGLFNRDDPGPATPLPVNPGASASVPSVFGYDVASATAMLEAEGFEVETEDASVCEPPGRAVGTTPAVGANVSIGSTLKVQVSTLSEYTDCDWGEGVGLDDRALAWEILDWANGRGPAPVMSDAVEVVLDSRSTTARGPDITAGRVPMVKKILSAFADSANSKSVIEDAILGTEVGRETSSTCGRDLGQPNYPNSDPLRLTIGNSGGSVPVLCPALTVRATAEGQVVGLVMRTGGPSNARLRYESDLSAAYIRCVASRGLAVAAQVFVNSDGVPKLVKTDPEVPAGPHRACFRQIGGGLLQAGHSSWDTYELTDPSEQSVDSPGWRDLPQYARGVTTQLLMADEVELYLGGQFMQTLTRGQAFVRANWDLCAPYAQRSCPMNALTTLADGERLISTGEPKGCLGSLAKLPARLDPPDGLFATIQPVGKRSCTDNWAVQVWADPDGRISAVNLLLGDP